MITLYLILAVTTLAMLAILMLTFFGTRMKTLMSLPVYQRAFSALAVLTVVGILLAASVGLTTTRHQRQVSSLITVAEHF